MRRRRWVLRSSIGALAILAGGTPLVWGQYAPAPPSRPRSAGTGSDARTSTGGATTPRGGPADQPRAASWERPEWVVQNALRANPVTAPYPIVATWRKGAVVLTGRVGTKTVHDAAVRLAIAIGYPFRDDLVIDTGETFRVAMSSTPSMTGYGALAPNLSASYYVYPQPLFGRLDDPFFGMVPPLVNFPPWARGRMEGPNGAGPNGAGLNGAGPNGAGPNGAGALAPNRFLAPNSVGPNAPNPGGAAAGPGPQGANHVPDAAGGPLDAQPGAPGPFDLPPAKGDLEITVDATGQVILQGVVASEEIAREIEQTARSVPGVTRVVARLQVQVPPRRVDAPGNGAPPPPPVPEPVVAPAADQVPVKPRRVDDPGEGQPAAPVDPFPAPAPPEPAAGPPGRPAAPAVSVTALDGQRLTRRVVASLRKRSAVADQPIQVRSSGDSVILTGKVPSAYEAMIAYRAAQQTPGARDVVDRLEFLVPDENHSNPLVQRGRPEDLEPYLAAQMARHVGDLAHIDSVKAHGDHLEIRGSLLDADDRDRALAILRSIPVLHGFHLNPSLTTD